MMISSAAVWKLASLPRLPLALHCARKTRYCFRCLHLAVVDRAASKRHNEHVGEAIKFSDSKAAQWNAQNSFGPPPRDMPSYQPMIVSLSVGVFLFYFLFLREENDMDVELNKTLFERVPGLEENQLRAAIRYNRDMGRSTADLENRLKCLLEEKDKLKTT